MGNCQLILEIISFENVQFEKSIYIVKVVSIMIHKTPHVHSFTYILCIRFYISVQVGLFKVAVQNLVAFSLSLNLFVPDGVLVFVHIIVESKSIDVNFSFKIPWKTYTLWGMLWIVVL